MSVHGFAIRITPVGDEGEGLHIEATSDSSHIIFESSKDGLLAHREKPIPQSPSPLPPAQQEGKREANPYQVKFNLGANPIPVTTTEGQMYVVLAYLREVNGKAVANDQAKAAKIAVSPQELDFVMDKTQVSDHNPKGFTLHKGDFVKASIKRRDFVQISGKPGNTRETPIRGYAFIDQPTLLNPKQKPFGQQ